MTPDPYRTPGETPPPSFKDLLAEQQKEVLERPLPLFREVCDRASRKGYAGIVLRDLHRVETRRLKFNAELAGLFFVSTEQTSSGKRTPTKRFICMYIGTNSSHVDVAGYSSGGNDDHQRPSKRRVRIWVRWRVRVRGRVRWRVRWRGRERGRGRIKLQTIKRKEKERTI